MRYDVAVVGLGAMGSMTAWRLARRGLKVIGFDRFHPPHANGSSAGLSRIIRECYFEQRYYVPLVQRAYGLWAELERASGRTLYTRTGGLNIGRPESAIASGAVASAEAFGIAAELLTAAEVHRRFPPFRLRSDEVALYEPRAGALMPEDAIAAALEVAAGAGAELRYDEPVLGWEATTPLRVTTSRGTIEAERLVLAAGAWMAGDLPRLGVPLTPTRQVLFWLEPGGGRQRFAADRFPVFIWQWSPGHSIYGFPDQGVGLKVAIHHEGQRVDPDHVDRTVRAAEAATLLEVLGEILPDAVGPVTRSSVCLYTNTRDEDFVIDFHPDDARVVVASPCSGHGFKFASAVGEVLTDLVTSGGTDFDLTPFRVNRAGLVGPRLQTDAHG